MKTNLFKRTLEVSPDSVTTGAGLIPRRKTSGVFIFERRIQMERDANKMDMDGLDKLSENIEYVQGIFELLYSAMSSGNQINSEGGLSTVIENCQDRMEQIKDAFNVLTAA
jgi:hypothetical protein